MKKFAGIIVLLLSTNTSFAGVIYNFYGYDSCVGATCTLTAQGRLSLNDDLSFSDWYFKNLVTGVDYSLNDPLIDSYNGLFGTLPAIEGVADILLDFAGDPTFFTTGVNAEVGSTSGSSTAWQHAFIEALQPTDDEGNLTPLQQQLNMVPIAGLSHRWVREVEVEVPEPGMLGLLGLSLAALVLRQRRHGFKRLLK
jgi:hypothetical protein